MSRSGRIAEAGGSKDLPSGLRTGMIRTYLFFDCAGQDSGRQGQAALSRVRTHFVAAAVPSLPMHRRLAGIVLVVFTACTPPSSVDETSSTTTTITAPTTTTTLGPPEAAAAFVECLRGEEIDVPDLALDGRGTPMLGELASSLDTTDAAVRASLLSCADLLGAAQVADLTADPEVRVLVADQLQAFSECMRQEGIDEFPDPGENVVASPYALEDVPFEAPGFDESFVTCEALVGSFGLER